MKAERFEQAGDMIIANAEILQEKIQFARGVFSFIAESERDYNALAMYAISVLDETQGKLTTIKNQTIRLMDLANPNSPDELPF